MLPNILSRIADTSMAGCTKSCDHF